MTEESTTLETDGRTREPTAEEAFERIRERASTVRDRQVETALARLDARGDLSRAEREAVERLGDRLVDRLLAVPGRVLVADESPEETDDERVETALELFG